jgi:hypothetical protein
LFYVFCFILFDSFRFGSFYVFRCSHFQFYKTAHEHIGEARVPDAVSGECEYPLIPNVNRTLCILPGRMDVARHFFKHGGVEGVKEGTEIDGWSG